MVWVGVSGARFRVLGWVAGGLGMGGMKIEDSGSWSWNRFQLVRTCSKIPGPASTGFGTGSKIWIPGTTGSGTGSCELNQVPSSAHPY